MSIATLKRKTRETQHVSGRGTMGFSLNNPRRVEAHHGEGQTQTPMRGTGIRGHGGKNGKFEINILKSQYVNSDSFTQVRPSVKNTRGMISTSYKWINRPYPHAVVQNQDQDSMRLQMLDAAVTKPVCGQDPVPKGKCDNWVKDPKQDYGSYYATTLLNKNNIPVPASMTPIPPRVGSNPICRMCSRYT